jgi:hypothetical protein
MHEDTSPPQSATDGHRYRSIEFADGLLIFDRENTAGWIHSERAVSLADRR